MKVNGDFAIPRGREKLVKKAAIGLTAIHISPAIVFQRREARNKKAPFGAFYFLAEWTGRKFHFAKLLIGRDK